MSAQFFQKLSQNYIELLEDDEYYDVTIEVGEDPNVKIFRAHMIILCHRSPYLRRALTTNKKNNNSVLSHLKLPKILPEIFQVILKYIYGGILSLNDKDTSDILKVLVTADELLFYELVEYLQTYLIENRTDWIEQHFELILRTSFQCNQFLELQKFCTDFITRSPEKVFKSLDFTLLPEKSLIPLLKNDDLQMKEIEVWEYVLKWGLAQNPTFTSDPTTWTDDDFKTMENTLRSCLPLIRYCSLSSKEFLEKVHPYKKLLNHQLYEELLKYYLDFEYVPNISINDNIIYSRNFNNLDSEIINTKIVFLVSKWIGKLDNKNCKCTQNKPYELKLLLRGSRDDFTPKKFHTLCDNKSFTITFIKVKGTNEILGGYNPTGWSAYGNWGSTKNSFIFSIKNRNDPFKDAIKSNVSDASYALKSSKYHGPSFGDGDLKLYGTSKYNDYDDNYCRQSHYESKIRDTEDTFSIEEYEVFQIANQNE